MATVQTLQNENNFTQTNVCKIVFQKGWLFAVVILVQLQPSPGKKGKLNISPLFPFCSAKEAIFPSWL